MPEAAVDAPALKALPAADPAPLQGLAAAIDAALPQTQCTRCGYPDCRGYAQAVAAGEAGIDRCPPGGAEGVRRLAAITGQAPRPLDAACGTERLRQVAYIDEAWCIGCTLCIKACPVDCIAGATKRMHTVIESDCTGCELCVPACPVDCIVLEPVTTATGWEAWSPAQAEQARTRYAAHRARLAQAEADTRERLIAKAEMKLADLPAHSQHQDPQTLEKKRSVIEAALARARAQRGSRV